VVATSVGGVPEIVEDEVSALLVRPKDSVTMAGTIDRLFADQELRARLTQTAAGLIKSNHTPGQHTQALIAIYRDAINRRHLNT
jgi:glycosyltransferase involved in cell wall biosynthesis